MAEPIRDLNPDAIRAELDRVRSVCRADTEILVASKYVVAEEMGLLAQAGVDLVGENQLQGLEAKQDLWGERFTWDFIGNLQSRKVRDIAPRVRLIHSLATESAAAQLLKHAGPGTEVLVQVNVAGEQGKGGIDPDRLGEFIEISGVTVTGLSTMPPFVSDPEASRPHFARLAELAGDHGLERLSMGTSQDWKVAVSEGATTIRLGSALLRAQPGDRSS